MYMFVLSSQCIFIMILYVCSIHPELTLQAKDLKSCDNNKKICVSDVRDCEAHSSQYNPGKKLLSNHRQSQIGNGLGLHFNAHNMARYSVFAKLPTFLFCG